VQAPRWGRDHQLVRQCKLVDLQLVLQVLCLCLLYLLALLSILCNKALLLLPRRERQLLQRVQVMLVVYLMLGILYESFVHPVTILSTLLSAALGALLALLITGTQFDIIGLIGIVLLIGIVMKNGIMMVDFALELLREQGLSPVEAIRQAAELRFRPILMTSMASLFGAVPLALGTGIGSELRHPLGIAIIGGLLLSQLLTLFSTPVIFLAMHNLGERFSRRQAAVE